MMAYRGKPADVRGLARDLGATHVLEGSVRREAKAVRVTLQLVDAVADRQIWSRSYQATLVDAMTLQEQLAREVAEQLAVQLPTARAGHLPPPRLPEAYDEWLKGSLAWQDVGGGGATMSQIARVEAMFTRAIELDETYGAAYADRARVRVARFVSHADGNEANLAGARADIAQAQKYTSGTPYVLVRAAGLAFLVDRNLPVRSASSRRPAGGTPRCGSAADQGQLPDVRRTAGGVAGRPGAGRSTRPGQRRHPPLLGAEPRRGAPSPRDVACAGRFRFAVPGSAVSRRYLFAFTGATGRWWEEIACLRGGGEANATLSASSTCCAMRDAGPPPQLDCNAAARSVRAAEPVRCARRCEPQSPRPNYAAVSVCRRRRRQCSPC